MDNIEFIQPRWNAPKKVRAFSTTRVGGFSQGQYDSLNLGLHVGDSAKFVMKNRALLPNYRSIVWLNQTHSAEVAEVDTLYSHPLDADASFTSRFCHTCAVMTADCLPILLCNIEGTEVAAVHGGWRGLSLGILENTISRMSSEPEQLIAWLGPAISAKAFEVGEDVFCRFNDNEKHAFGMSDKKGKYWLDLYGMATTKLIALGVTDVNQYNECTYTNNDFFSYRRDGVTGRMVSCIWIED
jgi:YfiH family protein